VPLHTEVRGSGAPLVLLHGFTQTGRLFGRFGEQLAESHLLVAVDLPGHGGSDAVRAGLHDTAGLVADSVRTCIGEAPCDVLGYSLGARVALHVASDTDLAVRRMILLGATAGIEDPAERERRRLSDVAQADALEASGDVEHFLERWLSGPMFNHLSREAADVAERRRNTASGLASSLRLCGTGTQEPSWDRLGSLHPAVLAMAGSDDARFAVHAVRIARLVPRGVASLVPGGGHAAHLSQPALTARIVGHWLAAVEPDLA
jgi:2-succinyl-6-hydroxy-2,4-cyclohexadiene-1-carboxylate synthase